MTHDDDDDDDDSSHVTIRSAILAKHAVGSFVSMMAVPIRFDSDGPIRKFSNRPCLPIARSSQTTQTALSGTVYRLASSMSDHTPVLFNVFEPLRIGMRNL